MKILLSCLTATALMLSSGCYAQTQTTTSNSLFLVQNGKARGVIMASAKPAPAIKNAIDELQYHLKRASGATLQVVDEKAAAALPADTARITFTQDKVLLPSEPYYKHPGENYACHFSWDAVVGGCIYSVVCGNGTSTDRCRDDACI
jgi:hypothetical protein